jgi:CRP/FNR family cyclic AMP-dependent transcriptional regulator
MMTHPEIFLKQVPLFRALPPGEALRMATLLKKQTLRKGDTLFREGQEGTALYIIIAGKIKISRQSRDGDEMILAVLGRGDFCGEMALLDGLPRSADAFALEETYLYGLNRRDFLDHVLNNEMAVHAVLSALSRRLRKADDIIEDIFFLNVSSRLAKRLIDLAEAAGYKEGQVEPVRLSVSQKDLAAMVGATRESVNKELRALRERDLIAVSGNTLLVLNVEDLRLRVP